MNNKIWESESFESKGTYAVTSELIRFLRYIYNEAQDQPLMQNTLYEMIGSFLKSPLEKWTITESDIILSILRGGSFSSLMMGSCALYKETQKCVILGFSEKVKVDNDLKLLDNEQINEFRSQMYCEVDPSKEKALVIFYNDNETEVFSPDVKAVELFNLIPIEKEVS
jgi:uncharacterized protein YlaN (UPF0358 family)